MTPGRTEIMTCENPRFLKEFSGRGPGLYELGHGACAFYSSTETCCSRTCEQELEELQELELKIRKSYVQMLVATKVVSILSLFVLQS